MLAKEFTSDQLPEVTKLVKLANHGQCQVAKWEFDFDTKSDTFYKLLMPKLLLELATDLRQVGSTNGVELYRRVVRRIGLPQENDAFHMGNEIRGFGGKGTLKDFSQTCRFLAFLEQKRMHYLLEISAAFPREDSGRVLVSVVNEDTMGRLEDAKVPLENYEKLVEWIVDREVRLTSRSTRGRSSRDPNAMVYAVGEGPSQYGIHTQEASSASQP